MLVFKGIGLTLIMIGSGLASAEDQFEIVDGTAIVTGSPNVISSQARQNWEASCDRWKLETKEFNKKDQIMLLSCQTPSCSEEDGKFVCSSNAIFKIKTAGVRVPSPAPVPAPAPVVNTETAVVQTAPPPVIIETVPAPRPGFVWINGYWGWHGHRHHWYTGHWEPHRVGYTWVSPRWTAHHHGGWRLSHGYWRH